MAYSIVYSTQFSKSLKRCKKRGLDMGEFVKVANTLAEGKRLPAAYRQHKLQGVYAGCYECHIKPDWLLVWRKEEKELVLLFIDTGTHADIFGK